MGGRISTLLALFFCCSCDAASERAQPSSQSSASDNSAEKSIAVPLSEIWTLDTPGTKDLASLLKDPAGHYIEREPKRLFDVARTALMKKLPEREARKLFAVSGTGRAALAAASEHLHVGSRQGIEPLPSSEEVSLVFFSHASSYDVRIEQVVREGSVFRVKYRFVPHHSAEATIQLALIPIGKLPAGHYPVEVIQLPIEKQYLDAGFKPVSEEKVKAIVCRPYTFQVYERPEPDPGPAEGATVIPLDQIWALKMPGTRDVRDLTPDPYADLSIGPLGVLELMGKNEAGPGYVVPGKGREALIAARNELPPGQLPTKELPVGTEVTVVFYSHAYSPYVVLHRVERHGNTINIRYRFDGSGETYMPSNFALIPLGKLPVGQYKVNMIPTWDNVVEESPSSYLDIVDDLPRVVCHSFEFTITSAVTE